MSVRTVSLNEVTLSDKPTHIIIYQESATPASVASQAYEGNDLSGLKTQLFNLSRQVEELSKKILHLELGIAPSEKAVRPSPFFGANVAPEPEGLQVRRLSDIHVETSNSKLVFQNVVSSLPPLSSSDMEVDDVDADADADQEEEEDEEEAEDADADADAEEEGQEEDEALELEEFEYKGVTYFKDSENQVYEKDADDDLNDTPIGIWNDEKKKVLRYKA